ncbi:DUF2062 domain-containing protein [Vulcanococcus limneticus]|uniref:DUF2062 domain-containing protein n=1 Tax=Vulcanococcus limneticus TaxID=2170428 RepID=UPI00398C10BA
MARRHPLLQRIRRILGWLWQQEGSASQRARGLAVGVFSGCFPFFGLQIVIGVALASVVRGNHLLAAAGTWISNPFTSLPLYWFNYQLGILLLGPGPSFPELDMLLSERFWHLGWGFASRLLLGSTVVGLICASLAGLLYWRWLHRQPAALGPAARRPRR